MLIVCYYTATHILSESMVAHLFSRRVDDGPWETHARRNPLRKR